MNKQHNEDLHKQVHRENLMMKMTAMLMEHDSRQFCNQSLQVIST